jgi:hypothetical protein
LCNMVNYCLTGRANGTAIHSLIASVNPEYAFRQ